MAAIKFTTGHTKVAPLREYLLKGGRALETDLVNIQLPVIGVRDGHEQASGFDWASAMDETRARFHHDDPWRGKAARMFRHYIISPDPKDGIGLAKLRTLAKRWAEENFGDHEVAIVYHDDNANHIPHAHVVINSTNLATGRRMREESPKRSNDSLQRICREPGLSSFEPRAIPHRQGSVSAAPPLQGRHTGRAERELESKGQYSWVADIRSRVEIAKAVARSEAEFVSVLSALGIETSDNSPRSDRRDFVYSFADHPTWKVRGEKLGLDYGRYAVERGFSIHGLDRASERRAVAIARNAVDVGDMSELRELSMFVATCDRYAARSIGELEELANRSTGQDRAQLMCAISFARQHEVIPAQRTAERRESGGSSQSKRWEQRPWRERPSDDDANRRQQSQLQVQQRRNRERNDRDR